MLALIQENSFAFITLGGFVLFLIIRDIVLFNMDLHRRRQAMANIMVSEDNQEQLMKLISDDRQEFMNTLSKFDDRAKEAVDYMAQKDAEK